MLTRDQVYEKLKGYLEEMFEVPSGTVTPESRLFEDLDLDSIDAVDLVVKLQALTGRKFKPEEFKTVRTVGDVLDRVQALLAA
ncbi:acyl carrier protein [Azospirillum sp. TSO35-2]|uniref:acyl carrier protein n=1 Tax=Azospirillum sp. TSO35-2 TaxID=716796 RepID=UPI000D614DEC|nr:acyl carrier protein [Azospirillum sp. TSO35-2]PWC35977.1 acyl carrier protein [Azospirillum sp. TSO35-2]